MMRAVGRSIGRFLNGMLGRNNREDGEHEASPARAEPVTKDACEADLDEAVDESFPASDPPALTLERPKGDS